MKKTSEFILIFRMDITTKKSQPTPEQMKIYMEQWDKWVNSIIRRKKLVSGNHLSTEGKILKPNNVISDGPYTAKKESVAGYIIIKARDFNKAVSIAEGCPILQGKGTSVEIRKVEAR